MRRGLYLYGAGGKGIDRILADAAEAEALGFDTFWVSQTFDYDALTLIGLIGRETRRIELGSWVVPTFPRHPGALAQAALTAQAATGGRLVLALGTSHRAVIEKRLGIEFASPVEHMRAYLKALDPLLAGRNAALDAPPIHAHLRLDVPGGRPPPVLVAALQPRMLALAGAASDGAALWLGSHAFLRDQALPRLRAAAEEAGRSAPRIVCGLPIAVTDDAPAGRRAVARVVGPSARLPSYRAVLEAGGLERAEDAALVGTEAILEPRLRALAELGVTDFHAVVVPVPCEGGSAERTRRFLADRSF
ncbi:MAG: LLM class F420-dependent oxidoreductase [Deltaproteobacteria bacterium]|nr:LLM class F420-dependent oxidoreductase [Deltaproteobacteria bacterium]